MLILCNVFKFAFRAFVETQLGLEDVLMNKCTKHVSWVDLIWKNCVDRVSAFKNI